jgi:hypothetical protein
LVLDEAFLPARQGIEAEPAGMNACEPCIHASAERISASSDAIIACAAGNMVGDGSSFAWLDSIVPSAGSISAAAREKMLPGQATFHGGEGTLPVRIAFIRRVGKAKRAAPRVRRGRLRVASIPARWRAIVGATRRKIQTSLSAREVVP